MAQHSEGLSNLPSSDPMLMCCMCECLMDKPQLLSCLHSCCLKCLQPSRTNDQELKATCPICQEAGSDVTCNVVVGSIVRRYEAIAKSSFCGMCAGRGADDQLAEVWCTSCSMSFCETCLPYHRGLHKAHCTIRIEDVKSWDEVFPAPSPLCSSHDKPIDFVCFSCKTCCCVECRPSCDQIKHDIKHISDPVVKSYVENAQGYVVNIARMLSSKTDVLCKRKKLAEALKIDLQNDLKKLQNRKLHLLKVIDDVCTTAEVRLRDTYDGLGATAEMISSSSETMEHKVRHTAEYSLYVVKSGTLSGLLLQEQRLSSRVNLLCSELDQLRQPLEAGQYVAFDSKLPDDEAELVELVTSWIGSPRVKTDDLCVIKAQPEISFASSAAVADDFCARKAQPESSTVRTAPAAQLHFLQAHPVDFQKYLSPPSDDPPLAYRLSAVDNTRHTEGASSIATASIHAELSVDSAVTVASANQAELSSGSAAAAAPAASAAAGYTSGFISKKPSSNESSSSEQAAQQNVQQRLTVFSSPRLMPAGGFPGIPVPLPAVDNIRRVEETSSAATATSGSSAVAATPAAADKGFVSILRRLFRESSSSELVVGVADSGETPAEEEPLEDFKMFLKKKGLRADQIIAEFERRFAEWKNIPLNIAMIGVSGSGKSSLINTLCKLKPNDPGAARVGSTATTWEPTPYEHPMCPKVKFWDLPGVGIPQFPRSSYLEKIRFHKYDAFIVVSSTRMCESDLWLADQIRRSDKHLYFVRTKVDIDVLHCKEEYPDINEELVLKNLRANVLKELEMAGFKEPTLFLVCRYPQLYDFHKFEERLICDLQKLKKNVMLLAARSHPEIKKLGRELTLL